MKLINENIVPIGPVRINENTYPSHVIDNTSRQLSNIHYVRTIMVMSNGEIIDNRKWLIYSKPSNSVFCFCCKLFSRYSNLRQSQLSTNCRNTVNLQLILLNLNNIFCIILILNYIEEKKYLSVNCVVNQFLIVILESIKRYNL